MKAFVRSLALLWVIIPFWACADSAAPAYQEGVNYELVTPPQPTGDPAKVEVVELFWYACPHCFHLEPEVKAWLQHKPANVTFIRIPAILSDRWELLGRAFYAAEDLGVLDRVHAPLFHALHEEHVAMNSDDDLVAFFVKQGVAEANIRGALDSFSVATKVNRARQLSERYGISGVPAFIVNGKYRTNATLAGGSDKIFKVVDFLVAKETAPASTR